MPHHVAVSREDDAYLGNAKITEIPTNLSLTLRTLWVNNNKLTEIRGLDDRRTMRALYAQNNQIRSLSGSIRHLKFLEVLCLYNNHIADLSAALSHLHHLHHLEHLDLFGNPVSNESNYRLLVIHTIPSLRVFDRHEVTDEERQRAKTLFGRKATEDKSATHVAFGRRCQHWVPPPAPAVTTCATDMENEAAQIKAKLEAAERAKVFGTTTVDDDDYSLSHKNPHTASTGAVGTSPSKAPRLLPGRDFVKIAHYDHVLAPSAEDLACPLTPNNKNSRVASRAVSRMGSSADFGVLESTTPKSVISKSKLEFAARKIILDKEMYAAYRAKKRLEERGNLLIQKRFEVE